MTVNQHNKAVFKCWTEQLEKKQARAFLSLSLSTDKQLIMLVADGIPTDQILAQIKCVVTALENPNFKFDNGK